MLRLLCSSIVLALVATPLVASADEPAPILVLPAVAAPCPACAPASPLDVVEHDDAPVPTPLVPRPFQLGLSGAMGTRPNDTGGLDATWSSGLDVGLRLTPREDRWLFVDLSLRRLGVGSATTLAGDRWALGGSPAISVGGRVLEPLEVYAQAGLGLQMRWGSQRTAIGAAPFVGGGVRFYFVDFFSVAIEGTLHIPATDGFLLGSEVFPQAAAIFQGGLALTFHLG